MKDQDLTLYKSGTLEQVASLLEEQLYAMLLQICTEADDIALQLRAREIEEGLNTEIYTGFCINFIKQLRHYQQEKIATIVPYLRSLSDKERNNHNCANCSHNCQVNHALQVAFIRESHEFAKTQLHRLNNLAVPVDSASESDGLYGLLRDKMFQIEKLLLESRFVEETILIPQVVSAQKAINVLT
jgi:hypothetical protein